MRRCSPEEEQTKAIGVSPLPQSCSAWLKCSGSWESPSHVSSPWPLLSWWMPLAQPFRQTGG